MKLCWNHHAICPWLYEYPEYKQCNYYNSEIQFHFNNIFQKWICSASDNIDVNRDERVKQGKEDSYTTSVVLANAFNYLLYPISGKYLSGWIDGTLYVGDGYYDDNGDYKNGIKYKDNKGEWHKIKIGLKGIHDREDVTRLKFKGKDKDVYEYSYLWLDQKGYYYFDPPLQYQHIEKNKFDTLTIPCSICELLVRPHSE